MKKLLILCWLWLAFFFASAQKQIRDESMANQQERMVFKQWDKGKFTPTSGFLGLNPYYWLTWGLHPNYPKTDLRPLGLAGPQTQRLAAVGVMQKTDKNYELQSDTIASVALVQLAGMSGALSSADPLWLLYYSRQLKGVTDFDAGELSASLPPQAREKIISRGMLDWYVGEINILGERLQAARTTTLERGARILSYHRILLDYRKLQGIWTEKVLAAARAPALEKTRANLNTQGIRIGSWTPEADIRIAKEILQKRKY